MEERTNHPSLPSNYVTLAQLQERWLKQKEKEKQLQEKHQRQQQTSELPQHNPRQYPRRGRRPKTQQQAWLAIPAHPTESGPAAGKLPPAEFGPENPKISETNRVAIELRNETLEAKADIGDGNAGQDGKKKKSKKGPKKSNRKPRVDKEKKKLAEDATQSTMKGNKEATNPIVQSVDDKTETKIELNGGKSNDLMMEVEQKLGNLSMNSGNDKQNSRLRPYNTFRGSQKNYGGRNDRVGPYGDRNYNLGSYGGSVRAQVVQRWGFDKKIWVRKSGDSNGNVDRNEITGDT